jgi:acyl carrier protein
MDETRARAAIVEVLRTIAPEVDVATLDATAPLREQVDLDSMDFLNFIVGLHDRLAVDIPESDYQALGTLDTIAAYLAAKTRS